MHATGAKDVSKHTLTVCHITPYALDMTTLLEDVEDFLQRTGMAASALGARFGDRHFVRQLRGGRRVWPDTEAKVRAIMAEHESACIPGSEVSASGKPEDISGAMEKAA